MPKVMKLASSMVRKNAIVQAHLGPILGNLAQCVTPTHLAASPLALYAGAKIPLRGKLRLLSISLPFLWGDRKLSLFVFHLSLFLSLILFSLSSLSLLPLPPFPNKTSFPCKFCLMVHGGDLPWGPQSPTSTCIQNHRDIFLTANPLQKNS